MVSKKKLPEVRQCTDPDDPQFGSVAIASGVPGFAWGYFHPRTGGGWYSDPDRVDGWTPLNQAKTKVQ